MPTPRRRLKRPSRKHIRRGSYFLAALLALAVAIGYHLAPSNPSPQSTLPLITEYPAVPEKPLEPIPSPSPSTKHPPLIQPSPTQPTPVLTPASSGKKGRLAIVIDDMGQDVPHTHQAMRILPPAVTFAFLPYPPDSPQLAAKAHKAGHTILVHMPSEPLSTEADPGPNTLLADDDAATLKSKIATNLQPLKATAVGVNNHMGSKFTQSLPGMRVLLQELNDKGYFFLDSLTINPTATHQAAQGLALPLLTRDTFLDHVPEEDKVSEQLDRAIHTAQTKGQAIAIGHPHPATLAVLQARLPKLPQGITLVPLTALLP